MKQLDNIKDICLDIRNTDKRGLKRKLQKYERMGVNLYDLACLLIVGDEGYRDGDSGYYILEKLLDPIQYSRERAYCVFHGIGYRKNRKLAYRIAHATPKEYRKEIIFKSQYTSGLKWKEFADNKYWRNDKSRNWSEHFISVLTMVVIMVGIISFPLLLNKLWMQTVPAKIIVISLIICWIAASIYSLITLFGKDNYVSYRQSKTKSMIGFQRRVHYFQESWAVILLWIMGGISLEEIDSAIVILYPGIALMSLLFLSLFLLDYTNKPSENEGPGGAAGVAFLGFSGIVIIIVITVAWGIFVIDNHIY